jgi:tetratricopeptide (TPR) repeat protein
MRSLVICALAIATTACSTEALKRRHFENGERHFAAKQFGEAIVEFQNAVSRDANWGEARFKLAESYAADGYPEHAYREFVRAADLLPQDSRAQFQAARYLLLVGQFDDARTRAGRVLELEPRNIDAQILMANALAGLRDPDGAVSILREAIAMDPSRTDAYTNLARVHLAEGRQNDALKAYTTALQIDPRSIEAHLALANFQWTTGAPEAAERTLKKALALAPDHVMTNRALATFYTAAHRNDEAERFLTTVVAATRAPEDELALADFYLTTRRLDEARRILTPLAQQTKTSGPAETRLARLEFLEGNTAAADERLQRVLARSPNYPAALLVKAQRSLRARNWNDALWEANVAITASPRLTAAYYVRAEAELQTRRFPEAMRSYVEILRLQPDDVEAKVALSRLHLARNEIDSGVLYAEEAIRNAPDHAGARLALVRAWIARGDDSLAATELTRLATMPSPPAEMFVLQGALAVKQGRTAAARRAFERAVARDPLAREAVTALTTMDVLDRKIDRARSRLEAPLRVEPDNAEWLVLAAKVELAAQQLTAAESLLRRAVAGTPFQLDAFGLLARVFNTTRRLPDAIREFDDKARREPFNVVPRLVSAVAVHTAGDLADAERRYQEILKIDAKNPLAGNNLAALYADKGENMALAEQLATTAVEQLPDAEIFDTLGSISYKRSIYGDAIKHFERAVALQPANAAFHYHLGMAYAAASDNARAKVVLSKALQLDPRLTAAQSALGALPH